MTKTLYLHVGMPKCASTSIQGMLRAHADVFQTHGKFYGMAPGDKTRGQGNMAVLLADIRTRRMRKVKRGLSFFFDRDSDVVMSSEMAVGLARTTLADDLVAQASEAGFTTRLICYVRRQDLWIESDYKQHVKGGADWRHGIGELIAQRSRNRVFDYHWLLENWARSLARDQITVVPLHVGQSELYPLERFLGYLDMDPALAEGLAVPRQNISPPVGLVEPARYLKAMLQDQGVAPARTPKYVEHFLTAAPGRVTVPPRRFLLSRQARQALVDRYAASNERLSNDYLDGAPAFDDLIEDDATPHPALAEEAATVLAAWIASDPVRLGLTSPVERLKPRLRRWLSRR